MHFANLFRRNITSVFYDCNPVISSLPMLIIITVFISGSIQVDFLSVNMDFSCTSSANFAQELKNLQVNYIHRGVLCFTWKLNCSLLFCRFPLETCQSWYTGWHFTTVHTMNKSLLETCWMVCGVHYYPGWHEQKSSTKVQSQNYEMFCLVCKLLPLT